MNFCTSNNSMGSLQEGDLVPSHVDFKNVWGFRVREGRRTQTSELLASLFGMQ